LDHFGDEVAIDVFVRLVAVQEHRRDGDAAIDAQEAVHELLEIRPVVFAEALGDDKGLPMFFPVLEKKEKEKGVTSDFQSGVMPGVRSCLLPFFVSR